MKAFLANASLRPSCFMCPAKRSCGSDITLGDFWGFQGIHPEVDYSKGVSAVICNSDKGIAAFKELRTPLTVAMRPSNRFLLAILAWSNRLPRMRSAMSLWQILLQGWVSRD